MQERRWSNLLYNPQPPYRIGAHRGATLFPLVFPCLSVGCRKADSCNYLLHSRLLLSAPLTQPWPVPKNTKVFDCQPGWGWVKSFKKRSTWKANNGCSEEWRTLSLHPVTCLYPCLDLDHLYPCANWWVFCDRCQSSLEMNVEFVLPKTLLSKDHRSLCRGWFVRGKCGNTESHWTAASVRAKK